MKLRSFVFALVLACVLPPLGASADGDATVEATMIYQGNTLKLDHVLIVRQGNEEGLGDGPELRIFLTDQAIPLAVGAGASTLSANAYVRQAKINGVVLLADPEGHKLAGQAHLMNAPGMAPGVFVSSSNSDAFSRLHVAGGRASGAASFDGDALKVAASFDAPVAANPITSDLKGKAALGSAPAKALLACVAALRSVDAAAMAKTYTGARLQQLDAYRTGVGDKAFRDAVRGQPDAIALAKTIVRTIVRGPNASVILADKSVSELVLEGDVWKCD